MEFVWYISSPVCLICMLLGLILFVLHTADIQNINEQNGMSVHPYADDKSLTSWQCSTAKSLAAIFSLTSGRQNWHSHQLLTEHLVGVVQVVPVAFVHNHGNDSIYPDNDLTIKVACNVLPRSSFRVLQQSVASVACCHNACVQLHSVIILTTATWHSPSCCTMIMTDFNVSSTPLCDSPLTPGNNFSHWSANCACWSTPVCLVRPTHG